MRQFDKILERYGILTEEDAQAQQAIQSALPPANNQQQQGDTNQQAASETLDNQQPAPTTSELSPQNFVMLVKLIRSAFTCSPTDEDVAIVNEMKFKGPDVQESNEINETNADGAFKQILAVVSKYTTKDKSIETLLKQV